MNEVVTVVKLEFRMEIARLNLQKAYNFRRA